VTPPRPVPDVLKELGASPGHKIHIVEGVEDLAAYGKWLTRLAAPNIYTATLTLVQAGGKKPVLQALRYFAASGGEPRVFVLVDRDEWDADTCTARRAELPQLRINEGRHAVESYFCDPDAVAAAVLAMHPGLDMQPLRDALDAAREMYVRHWALLTTTDRIAGRMTEINYPGQFSSPTDPPPSDADIQARFALWARTLDPAAAFAEFDALRADALARPHATQYRSCVWAFRFFDDVVVPALNALPGVTAQSGRDWMIDMAELGPSVPTDVEAILRPLI